MLKLTERRREQLRVELKERENIVVRNVKLKRLQFGLNFVLIVLCSIVCIKENVEFSVFYE